MSKETVFKVGDKVKEIPDRALGIGIIERISDYNTFYPINVRYGCGSTESYTLDGERYKGSTNTPYIEKIKDHVWEVGQKVFSARYGWGVVDSFIPNDAYPLVVYFNVEMNYKVKYKLDGLEDYNDKYPTLSFTNYIIDRFSQDPKDATYAQIEPDFDWGCLSALLGIGWIAKDKDGRWYAYECKPTLDSRGVFLHDDDNNYIEIHPDYYPKNSDQINWEKSLFKNPNHD